MYETSHCRFGPSSRRLSPTLVWSELTLTLTKNAALAETNILKQAATVLTANGGIATYQLTSAHTEYSDNGTKDAKISLSGDPCSASNTRFRAPPRVHTPKRHLDWYSRLLELMVVTNRQTDRQTPLRVCSRPHLFIPCMRRRFEIIN